MQEGEGNRKDAPSETQDHERGWGKDSTPESHLSNSQSHISPRHSPPHQPNEAKSMRDNSHGDHIRPSHGQPPSLFLRQPISAVTEATGLAGHPQHRRGLL